MTTILLPAGTAQLRYGDLADLIANALHDDPLKAGFAWFNLEKELAQAVMRGALMLRDPLTLGPHQMPIGAMRDDALVLLHDLRDFLKNRGIVVEVEATAQVEQVQPEPPPAPAQPQAAPNATCSASNAPEVKPKAKRRTWWDVSSAYIVEVMQAGQYATAKELYRVLERKAGPDSPFDKGAGANLGSLFVREIAQPVSMKTIQNNWDALRELAKS